MILCKRILWLLALLTLMTQCKVHFKANVDADEVLGSAKTIVENSSSEPASTMPDEPATKPDPTNYVPPTKSPACDTIRKEHDLFFDTLRRTEYKCTKDSDCVVLNGFVGCHFAAIASNEKETSLKLLQLLSESKKEKCKFNVCMTLRAFDAVCENNKCKLR